MTAKPRSANLYCKCWEWKKFMIVSKGRRVRMSWESCIKKESLPTSSSHQNLLNFKIKPARLAIKIPPSFVDSALLLSTITQWGPFLAIQTQHFHATPIFTLSHACFLRNPSHSFLTMPNKTQEIPICSLWSNHQTWWLAIITRKNAKKLSFCHESLAAKLGP